MQVHVEIGGGATMGLGAAARETLKVTLCRRIDRLAIELPHMSSGTLAFAVDDIGRLAHDNNLPVVAELARSLESAIAESSGATAVLPFLEAMSDAVDRDSVDPVVAQSRLASVSLRRHG